MMKHKLSRLFLVTAALLSPLAIAHEDALQECARIASALDRLDCYDAMDTGPNSPSTATQPDTPVAPVVATTAPPPVPAPAPTPSKVETPTSTAQYDEDDFGFEGKRFDLTAESLSTHYDGQFTGWSGKTLFRLENGQVWKQSQSGRLSYRRDRPLITIKKGAFGTYRLSVEGLNKTIRVKRVK